TFLGGADDNTSPMYRAFVVDARQDFALSNTLVNLMKGETGPFGKFDERLKTFACPTGFMPWEDFNPANYGPEDYVGMPYGVINDIASGIDDASVSFPYFPIKPTYGEVLMDYAEVEFILSEFNDWDQTHYENGIQASMAKWGVADADIASYMTDLPTATEETVLTQKYIALYMQPYQAWSEYRRTGYPDVLIKPNQVVKDALAGEYTFVPLRDEVGSDIINRVGFSQEEQLLNPQGFEAGVSKLGGPNNVATKLWWDVD
ncbi:MAG: SusD/RagB family nutrient-binding outer membrane lipoprotein, partial [Candidatus Cyclobacteriaceae bacterium M3_2C_046]